MLFFAVIVLLLTFSKITNAYDYPLKVSSNRRYLVDQKSEPVFFCGDAAWSLIVQLSREDVVYYLDDRKRKGFNVLLVNLIDRAYSTNPPTNFYGELPFTGNIFTTPNENYFIHADFVIREASKRNMLILLCPFYLGYKCGSDGWCADVEKASLRDMRTWGRYLGERYKNHDNIVWCVGGDADPTPIRGKILQCIEGIRENDKRHLFTSHNQPGSFGTMPWDDESWLNINNVYTYSTSLYRECKAAFGRTPIMPYFLIEAAYENEHHSSQEQLRSQVYWTILSGGFGFIFGNCPIWHFDSAPNWCGISDWKSQLDSSGSFSMMQVNNLFKSREWHLLVPDFQHEALIDGYGFWDELLGSLRLSRTHFNTDDYVTAAITKNGNTMIAYLPSSRKIRIDMSKISGTAANCWWFKPSDGSTLKIGSYQTSGTRWFEPPSKGDWVIVIDNASLNLPAPGRGR